MTSRKTKARRGFTLIEVLAAFLIAMLMLAPVALILAGAAGTMGAIARSAERQAAAAEAARIAASITAPQPGRSIEGDFVIDVTGVATPRPPAGWRLVKVRVARAVDPTVTLAETIRLTQ